jgi:hypothetical protein
MNISTNCPFTLDEYRSLVQLAKRRFPFVHYDEYGSYDSFVLWRHDVEFSVDEMNKLVEIDTEEGISSTLFIQLHWPAYNFWDKEVVNDVKRWITEGHQIGLHFDAGYYGDENLHRFEDLVLREKRIIEDIYQTKIAAAAYHAPSQMALTYQRNFGNLVNAYNKDLFGGNVVYVSDSNGRWREKTVRDVLEDPGVKKVQVNTHDTWWTNERIPQIQKLENAWRRQAEKHIKYYRDMAIVVVEDVI